MQPLEDPLRARSEEAEDVILRWNSAASEVAGMIFQGDRAEVDRYLMAVDEIQRSMSSVSMGEDNDKVPSTIQIAMNRLENEFRSILLSHVRPLEVDWLLRHSNSIAGSSGGSGLRTTSGIDFHEANSIADGEDLIGKSEQLLRSAESSVSSSRLSIHSMREIDLIPSETICDLRCIAERMVAAGYTDECVKVYGNVRKSAVDACFQKLGFENLAIGDIQRLEWDILEVKIKRWIRDAKFCMRIVFPSERSLCKEIFSGIGTAMDDECFSVTVMVPAIRLFSFAEAVSISHRSPEKLFKILDLRDALSDLLPDIDAVFGCKSLESFPVQAAEILSRLAEAARGILSEFENAVLREPSQVPIPGGTIHPLTRYVMNYISLISDYKQTLISLILSKPSTGSRYSSDPTTPDIEFAEVEGRTPLTVHLIWILVVLLSNLEGKSKFYKDTSLSHLFMMNNVHYIVQKVKGSPELLEMIGDEYVKKLTRKYRQAATCYHRATWVRVLHCLRDEGLYLSGSFSSGVSKNALRERFKIFNSMFDEVRRTQALWLVPDSQLREELRILISENLIPAYRSFLGRFRSHIESGRHPETYIKYSVEGLENAVSDFFEGRPVPMHSRRRSR